MTITDYISNDIIVSLLVIYTFNKLLLPIIFVAVSARYVDFFYKKFYLTLQIKGKSQGSVYEPIFKHFVMLLTLHLERAFQMNLGVYRVFILHHFITNHSKSGYPDGEHV